MTASAPERERVGIFGGTFNPPHVAHLIIAESVREEFRFDRILWIPNNRSPLKERFELADAEDRLAMTRAATVGNDAFTISKIEIRRSGVSYTVDTVRTLQERHPNAAFHLIVGSDSLAQIDRWHEPKELLERVPFIVFRRPGSADVSAPAGFEDRIAFADAPLLEISSTEIRRRIRSRRSIRYMVPQSVDEYVRSRDLYR